MIVIADRAGRLGNRLIVFSHIVAVAAETGVRTCNPGFGHYAHKFEMLRRDPLCRFPPVPSRLPRRGVIGSVVFGFARVAAKILWMSGLRRTRWTSVVRAIEYDRVDLAGDEFRLEARKPLVFAQGWRLRNERALGKQASIVREFLRPTVEVEESAAALVAPIRAKHDVVVGVHLRQTDYRVHLGGRYYFDTSHYVEVMRSLASLFPGRSVGFFACSDEPPQVGEFEDLDVAVSRAPAEVDMHALSLCDAIVGPPSSFSLWASFRGETPLFVMTGTEVPQSLDDLRIYPNIKTDEIRSLY